MDDVIRRQDAIDKFASWLEVKGYSEGKRNIIKAVLYELENLPSAQHKCKDCKWWKDSDGVYRRGIFAESQCPINSRKVYEGDGYCYMFEPQESEDKDGTA